MDLLELQKQWNKGLERVRKAEKVAKDNPELFEKFIDEFTKLCREMSSLMNRYRDITGQQIPSNEFDNGFKL